MTPAGLFGILAAGAGAWAAARGVLGSASASAGAAGKPAACGSACKLYVGVEG